MRYMFMLPWKHRQPGPHLHQLVLPEVQPYGLDPAGEVAMDAGAVETHKHAQLVGGPVWIWREQRKGGTPEVPIKGRYRGGQRHFLSSKNVSYQFSRKQNLIKFRPTFELGPALKIHIWSKD